MRLRALIELVRAPAALSVPGDPIAGAAAAGVLGPGTAGLATASTLLYLAGMAANDWADRDLDAVERPHRPIPSGRISPPAALAVATGLTAAGLATAALTGGRRALAVAVPLAAAVWCYDLRLKNTAAGPAAMAACRALDVLLGASPGRWPRALPAATAVAVHTWTVTALSRSEVSGAPPGLAPATLAVTAALAATLTARGPARDRTADLLTLLYATGYGRAQAALLTDPAATKVRAAVTAGLTSLPALQAALTARAGQRTAAVGVAAALPVARLLARKVSPT